MLKRNRPPTEEQWQRERDQEAAQRAAEEGQSESSFSASVSRCDHILAAYDGWSSGWFRGRSLDRAS
jgi:hypothetical protein